MITTDEHDVTTVPGIDGRRSLNILPYKDDGFLVLMVLGPQQGLREVVRVKGTDLATAVARARNRSRFLYSAEHMLMEGYLDDIERESGADSALEARVSIIVYLQRTGQLSPYDLQVLTEHLSPGFKKVVKSQIRD